MNITFLGTSHGIPEPNRRCSCTMLEFNDNIYFIDMGVMAIYDMITLGKKVENVKSIFITHLHGDHSNGLFSFIDLINWYYKLSNPSIIIPNINAEKIFDEWLNMTKTKSKKINYIETVDGLVYKDNNIIVTAQKTMHCNRSFAYLIENNDKRILFTGDLSNPSVDFPSELCKNKIDLAVLEAAHFPATEYSPIIEKYNFQNIIFNHYAPWNIPNIQKLITKYNDKNILLSNDYLQYSL